MEKKEMISAFFPKDFQKHWKQNVSIKRLRSPKKVRQIMYRLIREL
nr:MAG TPA: hypothetical protein [Caudoviricetes sp.]